MTPTVTMERVVIPLGANRTLNINGLRRAALANPKVARARAVNAHQLLITSKAKGKTVLRAWTSDGRERLYAIEVLSPHLLETENQVVKVFLQFLELDESGRRETGIRWPELLSASASGLLQGTASSAALTYTLGLSSAPSWIQQLVREGHAKVLARPELYVRLGEEVRFSSGGEIPVPTSVENFGRVQKGIEWKPFGMSVIVKPESADLFHLHSTIALEISELDGSQAINGVPAINRRKLSTKVNSTDGQTILLSGLVRASSSKSRGGLPGLSELPVLGVLFSEHGENRESSEILMAMTLSIATHSQTHQRWEDFESRFERAGEG